MKLEGNIEDESGTVLYLNLNNFESNEASDCPYILTSPRSLKACRKINIRPIELLHKSIDEIAEDLGLPTERVYHIYVSLECQRKKKLELCKGIRDNIIKSENMLLNKQNVFDKAAVGNTRKKILSANAEYDGYMVSNYSPKRSIRLSGSTTSSTILTDYTHDYKLNKFPNRYSLSTCSSLSSLIPYSYEFKSGTRSKSAEYKQPFITNITQQRSRLQTSNQSKSAKQDIPRNVYRRKTNNVKQKSDVKKYNQKYQNKIEDKKYKISDRELSYKVNCMSKKPVRLKKDVNVNKAENSVKYNNNNNKNGKKIINNGNEYNKSSHIKNIEIPVDNRKKCDNSNTSEKISATGMNTDMTQPENQTGSEKTVVKDENNRGNMLETKGLKNNIGDHVTVKRLQIPNNKSAILSRNISDHDVRILDALAIKCESKNSLEDLAYRSHLLWDATMEDEHLKNRNISSNFNHTFEENDKIEDSTMNSQITITENSYQIYPTIIDGTAERILTPSSQQKESTKNRMNNYFASEKRAFEKYINHVHSRLKHLKETSLYRELHSEQVRQLARELQAGMEQWQDQVLLLQWQALQRAQTNAKLQLENKRLRTQCENNERALLHAQRMKNLKHTELLQLREKREEIEAKDYKIERLRLKRERELLECRTQAQNTAELRNQLRMTLTPETFDQKVNKAILGTRFIRRSLTASPVLMQSHIRLG